MKRRNLAALVAATTSLAIIPTTALAVGGDEDRSVVLNNSGTAVTKGAGQRVVMHGAAAQTAGVKATLQLPLRNQEEAQALIAQGVTLTPEQYRAKFSPSQQQVEKVTRWAKRNGLTVSNVNRESGTIAVSSQVKTANRAFGVSLQRASLGRTNGMAVNTDPKVPASLGLSGISGLNTLHRMSTPRTQFGADRKTVRPAAAATKAGPGKQTTSRGWNAPAATPKQSEDCATYWGTDLAPTAKKWANQSNYLCGYTPADLARMYSSTGAAKQKPTIGILLWGGDKNMKAVTNAYMKEVGYPQLTDYTSNIAPADDNMNDCDPDGVKGEHALDVQSSHAIAPSAPIRYFGAASCYDDALTTTLATMVSERKVSTISMSFGSTTDAGMTDADKAAWDRPFQQAALTGISVFASTGDWGNNSELNGGPKGVGHPASSTNVTAVGGTAVGMTKSGAQPVLAGWENRYYNQPNPGSTRGIVDVTATQDVSGAGGGVSESYQQPTWQKGVVSGSTTMRMVPDVSAVGDPTTGFTTHFTSGGQTYYSTIGGTSLSSPITAALVALSKAQTGRKIGLATPWIYKLRGTSAIKDVNSPGEAGVWAPASTGEFNLIGFDAQPQDLVTKAGWDNVTGVGTPSTAAFLSNLGQK